MHSTDKLLTSISFIKKANKNKPITGSVILPNDVAQKLYNQNTKSIAAVPARQNRITPTGLVPSYYNPILEAIRKAESNVAGYDTMVGSTRSHKLTGMTLKQVMDYQKKHKPGSAAGAYQIISPTMRDLVAKMKLDPNKEIYNRQLQDRMALQLLQRRGFDSYLSGKTPLNIARTNIAKEWAGLPATGNKSYYTGVGNNAARISEKEFLKALELSRKLYLQNQSNINAHARSR